MDEREVGNRERGLEQSPIVETCPTKRFEILGTRAPRFPGAAARPREQGAVAPWKNVRNHVRSERLDDAVLFTEIAQRLPVMSDAIGAVVRMRDDDRNVSRWRRPIVERWNTIDL